MVAINMVFDFTISFEGDFENGFEPQHRYVVATTEEEAVTKLEERNTAMQKLGYAPFEIVGYPTVELDYVIV